jgi:hypothetical protein
VSLAKAYGKLLSKGPNVFVAKNDVELADKISAYVSSKNNYSLASANWSDASYALTTVVKQLKLV